MPDNELRLRENVQECLWDVNVVFDEALVVGGYRDSRGYWVAGDTICHFGIAHDGDEAVEGRAPSPDDARRIERAWNCFDELVAAVHDLVDLTERSCPNCEGSIEAYERGKAILATAKPEGVPSLSRPGVHQGQTPKK